MHPEDERFFEKLTQYVNAGDNEEMDLKRAELLGLGGRNIRVAPGAIIRVKPENFGEDIFIGLYCYLNANVYVGNHVLIGPHCSLPGGNHKFDPETGYFSARDDNVKIVIGDGCWLCSNVTVAGGVTLGKANLICAGAVVTHDTEDYAIMAGVPAKKIGEIDPVTGEYHWYH